MLKEASVLIAASILAAFVLWIVDLATWPSVRRPWSLLVSSSLAVANGAATGLAILLFAWAPARTRWPLRTVIMTCAVSATMLLAAWDTPDLSTAPAARAVVSAGVVGVAVLMMFGLTTLVRAFERDAIAPRHWIAIGVLALTAGCLIAIDRLFFAGIERLYSAIEGVAHVALALSCAGMLLAARPLRSSRRVVLGIIAAGACLWLVVFASSRPLRRFVERYLPGVWDEAVYTRRWLRRARRAESQAASHAELARLSTKYQIDVPIVVDEAWRAPERSPTTPPAASGFNVVVFFVDTLRDDVARDASIMPETVAWSNQSIAFTRAYASGSSTLLTLAPMLGCRYDAKPTDRPRLLDTARASGMTTGVVIPRHAFDYHRATFPAFRFDEEVVVEGHVPVAAEVVQRSLGWLRENRTKRFFLWLYQHDVHAWGDLAGPIVASHAKEARFQDHDGVHWHYRAAARGVDQAFARLRRGLEDLGLDESTVVVFISDHGEALGKNDFWTHSTHLWESLIRVPLVVRVPNRAAQIVDEPVSTIDLLPTLAPLLGAPASTSRCHGVDLLSSPSPRPLPILFSAMVDGRLSRVGMLSGPERKLVVDLDGAEAHLLQVSGASDDERDVTHDRPEELAVRLNEIVRAPIYVRED